MTGPNRALGHGLAIILTKYLTNCLFVGMVVVMGQDARHFLDAPPSSQTLTSYDREHMVLYLRLLDAARDGADWREAVQILFGLDPDHDLERCRRIHESHLARAVWMTEHGYRDLVRESQQRAG